ncbi:MAG TPA: hypothetical protein VMH39_00740 [Gemmatimonadaceae bacterium]|nr:hypothetical protein [Gemmatimonadaceae bacterium]
MKTNAPPRRRAMLEAIALFAGMDLGKALAQDAVRSQPGAYRVVLENERVRVLEFRARPGMELCGVGKHSHPAHLTIALTEAKVRVTLADGTKVVATSKAGDVFWSEAETHTTENIGGGEARALIVELKEKTPA